MGTVVWILVLLHLSVPMWVWGAWGAMAFVYWFYKVVLIVTANPKDIIFLPDEEDMERARESIKDALSRMGINKKEDERIH